jgi:hypothetical protein
MVLQSYGQEYRYSAGLRGGYSSGITFEAYLDDFNAFKGLMSWRDKGMQFTGLFEHYKPVFTKRSDHFFVYYGIGGHIGYTRWYKKYYSDDQYYTYYENVASPVFGIDGIVGLEFRLYKVPLAFDLDFKPFVEVFGQTAFKTVFSDFAFGIKYNF